MSAILGRWAKIFTQPNVPSNLKFVSAGEGYLEVEVPKEYTSGTDILNNTYASTAAIVVDTKKRGNAEGSRVFKLIGTNKEIIARMKQISNKIDIIREGAKKPWTEDDIELIRAIIEWKKTQKNGGQPVSAERIDTLVAKEVAEHNREAAILAGGSKKEKKGAQSAGCRKACSCTLAVLPLP